ncbi:MAG: hypothetical protein WA151_22205, partial [Desulfatirhabdiaceae bacterium]
MGSERSAAKGEPQAKATERSGQPAGKALVRRTETAYEAPTYRVKFANTPVLVQGSLLYFRYCKLKYLNCPTKFVVGWLVGNLRLFLVR